MTNPEIRWVWKFAWFPRKFYNQTIWLRFVKVKQEFKQVYSSGNGIKRDMGRRWIDIDIEAS